MSEKHILVQGGTVYCSQSICNNSPATAVPITVTSQRMVDANGGKAIATEKDCTIVNVNFGSCNDPKSRVPPPCLPQIQWTKFYKGVAIGEEEVYPLTEESEGICKTCSIPGQIKIAFHGQQATVVEDELSEAELEIMENLNPMSPPLFIVENPEEINISEF